MIYGLGNATRKQQQQKLLALRARASCVGGKDGCGVTCVLRASRRREFRIRFLSRAIY